MQGPHHVAVKSIMVSLFWRAALWILESRSASVEDSWTAPPRMERMFDFDVVDVLVMPKGRGELPAITHDRAANSAIRDVNSSFILASSCSSVYYFMQ